MTREMPGVFHAADKLLACFFQSATIMPCERAGERDAVVSGLSQEFVTTRKQATAAGFFMRCSAAAKNPTAFRNAEKRTTPLAVASSVALTPLVGVCRSVAFW